MNNKKNIVNERAKRLISSDFILDLLDKELPVISIENLKDGDKEVFAIYDPFNGIIINKSQPEYEIMDSFWHEFLCAIECIYGYGEMDKLRKINCILSIAIHSLLLNNPQIIEIYLDKQKEIVEGYYSVKFREKNN